MTGVFETTQQHLTAQRSDGGARGSASLTKPYMASSAPGIALPTTEPALNYRGRDCQPSAVLAGDPRGGGAMIPPRIDDDGMQ